MKKSLLLSIQKFSVHDGPGIRTTIFFKGCPLRCHWCHNPESQSFRPELLIDPEKCSGCLACISCCPAGVIQAADAIIHTDRQRCTACGRCVPVCRQNARSLAGKPVDEAAILATILQDQIFYEESGGGVTFSGGEALCHSEVLTSLAAACKRQGLHVAVDTCGYAPQVSLQRILPFTDLFLYDLKQLDPLAHRSYTGQDNRLILTNLRWLSDAGAEIWLRIPLIDGVNTAAANIDALLRLAATLRIRQVNLLPYHPTGSSKAARLGRKLPGRYAPPSPERLDCIRSQFEAIGLPAFIGG